MTETYSGTVSSAQFRNRLIVSPLTDHSGEARYFTGDQLKVRCNERDLHSEKGNSDLIQMQSFIPRLARAIAITENRASICMKMQVESLEIPIKIATRVGLVVSELLASAFQHAFDRMKSGLIEIRMPRLSACRLRLIVSDDGVGLPENTEWPPRETFSGRIISYLIEGLEGKLHLGRSASGSFVSIDVPAGTTLSE